MKIYKHWITFSFLSIITIVIIVSFFNYKVDSLSLYGNNRSLEDAARSLTQDNIVAGLQDYDERLFQKYIIQNLSKKIDTIVVGASTSMNIRKRDVVDKDTSFFNHSISSGLLEDIIAILGIYEKEHGYLPKNIILGLTPQSVFNSSDRYESILEYYKYETKRIGIKKSNCDASINKFAQLFNYEILIKNVKELFKPSFYITDIINVDDYIRETDGSIHYPYKTRYRSNDAVKKLAINSINDRFFGGLKIDKTDKMSNLESLLKYLKNKDINVSIYLAPFNPLSYDMVQERYCGIVVAENSIRKIAKDFHVKIYGSYDPTEFKLKNSDFYDSMHAKDSIIKNIFKNYKE